MDPRCLLGLHAFGDWFLRPTAIAIRIEWLRWERRCTRCTRGAERRWFHVAAPTDLVVPRVSPGSPLMTPQAYLELIGATAPDPDSLSRGTPPGIGP